VRFAALARRAASWHADLARPHDKSVLWGHMLTMNRHWRDSHTVPAVARKPHLADGDDGRWTSGDESWRAEWYDYPAGFGYLMRCVCALAAAPHAADPPVARTS
jgi:hypothetical protein